MSDVDYSGWDAYDLLEALELSGERPDPDLIRAILARRDQATPGLLDMFGRGTQPHWEPDDPRWYRDIHAGLLLIALRAEKALPLFEAVLRDPERADVLEEWYEMWLPDFGPPLVPVLVRVAQDENAPLEGRTTAIRLMGAVGERYPETREPVLPVLRALLPALEEDGTVPGEPTGGAVELWSWAVSSLAELRDEASRDQIRTLYDQGLVDEDVTGDLQDVEQTLAAEPITPEGEMGLVEFYENLDTWNEWSDAELAASLRDALLDAGLDESAADEMMEDMLDIFGQDLDDEEDVATAMLERLAGSLREAGVPEEEIQRRVEQSLARMYDDGPEASSGPVPDRVLDEGETFTREEPKHGRNDPVVVEDPDTGERRSLKYKHARKLIDQGWLLVASS